MWKEKKIKNTVNISVNVSSVRNLNVENSIKKNYFQMRSCFEQFFSFQKTNKLITIF
jgi:hypothetical protein